MLSSYIYCFSLTLDFSNCCFFFFNDTATTEIYTLSLHDALPISTQSRQLLLLKVTELNQCVPYTLHQRSEEHTSELQSHSDLVCRLLLEKKKKDGRVRQMDLHPLWSPMQDAAHI